MSTDIGLLTYTEAEFDLVFKPLPGPDGSDIWEHADTLKHPRTCVWSIVEIDGDLFAIPGYHVVNVIGYSVTQTQWPHDHIEVQFDTAVTE
jgi:hypothetical protein